MFAKTAVVILAAAASFVSALPEPPSRVKSAPEAKRTEYVSLLMIKSAW